MDAIGSRRDGVRVYYRVVNSKILQACDLIREVLMERLGDMSKLREAYTRTP
ncbi:MAG: hypothetical protein ACE5LH_09230 [Fidelibacterota bacterium]